MFYITSIKVTQQEFSDLFVYSVQKVSRTKRSTSNTKANTKPRKYV